jgi:hypothetical protein
MVSSLAILPTSGSYCCLLYLALLSTSFLMLVWTSWTLAKIVVGGGGPDESLGIGVPVGDVGADLSDEDLHGGEGAAAEGLAANDAKTSSRSG